MPSPIQGKALDCLEPTIEKNAMIHAPKHGPCLRKPLENFDIRTGTIKILIWIQTEPEC